MAPPLYLLRHGQSEWNLRRLTQGQTMHPRLTDLGRAQARSAARTIAADLELLGQRVDQVVTSDLLRAVETAEILVGVLGGELCTDPRLREQHLGQLEGRGYDETWAAAEQHDWSDPELPLSGGESLRQVHHRMAAAMAAADQPVVRVLVSHGDAIRAAIAHLGGFAPNFAPWVEVPNGSVARVDVDGVVTWLPPRPPGSGVS